MIYNTNTNEITTDFLNSCSYTGRKEKIHKQNNNLTQIDRELYKGLLKRNIQRMKQEQNKLNEKRYY